MIAGRARSSGSESPCGCAVDHQHGMVAAPARAVFAATDRCHAPALAAHWSAPDIDATPASVRDPIIGGLRAPRA